MRDGQEEGESWRGVDELQEEGGICRLGGDLYTIAQIENKVACKIIYSRKEHCISWCSGVLQSLYTAICSDRESLNNFISPVGKKNSTFATDKALLQQKKNYFGYGAIELLLRLRFCV